MTNTLPWRCHTHTNNFQYFWDRKYLEIQCFGFWRLESQPDHNITYKRKQNKLHALIIKRLVDPRIVATLIQNISSIFGAINNLKFDILRSIDPICDPVVARTSSNNHASNNT